MKTMIVKTVDCIINRFIFGRSNKYFNSFKPDNRTIGIFGLHNKLHQ